MQYSRNLHLSLLTWDISLIILPKNECPSSNSGPFFSIFCYCKLTSLHIQSLAVTISSIPNHSIHAHSASSIHTFLFYIFPYFPSLAGHCPVRISFCFPFSSILHPLFTCTQSVSPQCRCSCSVVRSDSSFLGLLYFLGCEYFPLTDEEYIPTTNECFPPKRYHSISPILFHKMRSREFPKLSYRVLRGYKISHTPPHGCPQIRVLTQNLVTVSFANFRLEVLKKPPVKFRNCDHNELMNEQYWGGHFCCQNSFYGFRDERVSRIAHCFHAVQSKFHIRFI